MTPPGLAWLKAFCSSTGTALDQGIVADAKNTVNPLVYTVYISWKTPIVMKSAVMVWNLFQKWAAANKTTTGGRTTFVKERNIATKVDACVGLIIEVHLRERLGPPKDKHP